MWDADKEIMRLDKAYIYLWFNSFVDLHCSMLLYSGPEDKNDKGEK